MRPSAAAFKSADSNTMNGPKPPSSNETFFTVDAELERRIEPTWVDPVNEIALILSSSQFLDEESISD